MKPRAAIQLAIKHALAAHVPDVELISGLEHADECLRDTGTLLRYIRTQVPDREPELKRQITKQLIKGCDLL